MGANITVRESALSDVRFAVLATLCGLADGDHARGKLERLWAHCTREQRYVLAEHEISSVLGDAGVNALITAKLGRRTKGGIYLKGTRGMIEWYGKLLKASKKGVAARLAKKADQQVDLQVDLLVDPTTTTSSPTPTSEDPEPEMPAMPAAEVPAPGSHLVALAGGAASAPLQLLKPSPPDTPPVPPPKEGKRKKPTPAGYSEFVAHWDERYKQRTGGAAYHWGKRAGEQVKDLLARPGGLEVACARAAKLFDDPPRFLRGTVPDLATLQAHWDKLADVAEVESPRGGTIGYAEPVASDDFPDTGWADIGATLENM